MAIKSNGISNQNSATVMTPARWLTLGTLCVVFGYLGACARTPYLEADKTHQDNLRLTKKIRDLEIQNQRLEKQVRDAETDHGKEMAVRAAGFIKKGEVPVVFVQK